MKRRRLVAKALLLVFALFALTAAATSLITAADIYEHFAQEGHSGMDFSAIIKLVRGRSEH